MKNTKKTKTTLRTFAAWDYEWEAREYDRMSRQGWQLTDGGSFLQKYTFDDSVVYRHQLDFNAHIEDTARYEETFREAGWERVFSTSNGWHVFRKRYETDQPDEAYEIYTDASSRNEMLTRLRNMMGIIGGVVTLNLFNILRVTFEGNLPIGLTALGVYALLYSLLIRGIVSINRQMKGETSRHPFPMGLFLTILLLLTVGIFDAACVVLIQEGSYGALGVMVGILTVIIAVLVSVFLVKKDKYRK